MNDPTAAAFLASARQRFAEYRRMAERALDQTDDDAFFHRLSTEADPIAVTVKHVGGNLRSRWRDALTADGEKPDRQRDTEFVLTPADTRDALMARWAEGWDLCLGTLDAFTEADVLATLTIRHEPHTVLDAVHRSLAHTAYHVGQIVLLAKHHSGARWQGGFNRSSQHLTTRSCDEYAETVFGQGRARCIGIAGAASGRAA